MSHTNILVHYVFRTQRSEATIVMENDRQLYAYIYGICSKNGIKVLRINGMPDHIHMLLDIGANISVADAIKAVKQSSSRWLRDNPGLFPRFSGWGKGYFAESVSMRNRDDVINYIIGQKAHHQTTRLDAEMSALYVSTDREEDLRYFFLD